MPISKFVGVPLKPKPCPVETPCENEEYIAARQEPPGDKEEYKFYSGPTPRGARPQPQADEVKHEDFTVERVQASDAAHSERAQAPMRSAASAQPQKQDLRMPVYIGGSLQAIRT